MYVFYLFAGYEDHELLECTSDNGGEKACATFLDFPSCGISTGPKKATKQSGSTTTISAKVSATASGILKGIGITIGAEASGSHTVTTEDVAESIVGDQNINV